MIIFLLLISVQYCFYCTDYLVHRNQLHVLFKIPVKHAKAIPHQCSTIPVYPYLPVRAGQISKHIMYTVVPLNKDSIKGSGITEPIFNSLLFYIKVLVYQTTFRILIAFQKSSIAAIVNNKSTIHMDSLKDLVYNHTKQRSLVHLHEYTKKVLVLDLLNSWNQLYFNQVDSCTYRFSIYQNKDAILAPFIPWNTVLPPSCYRRDQYARDQLEHICGFDLPMDFTYGQKFGLEAVRRCLWRLMHRHSINATILTSFTRKYTLASFYIDGSHLDRHKFYQLLINRNVSFECIEYACIDWKIKVPSISQYTLPSNVSLSSQDTLITKPSATSMLVPIGCTSNINDMSSKVGFITTLRVQFKVL